MTVFFGMYCSTFSSCVQFTQKYSSPLALQSLSPLHFAAAAQLNSLSAEGEVLTDVIFSIEKSSLVYKSYISLKARICSLAKLE